MTPLTYLIVYLGIGVAVTTYIVFKSTLAKQMDLITSLFMVIFWPVVLAAVLVVRAWISSSKDKVKKE